MPPDDPPTTPVSHDPPAIPDDLRALLGGLSIFHAPFLVGPDGTALGYVIALTVTDRREGFRFVHASDPQGLIKAADEALYESKRSGRDRVTRSRRSPATNEAFSPTD